MSKIINLTADYSSNPAYREALSKAAERLEEIKSDLIDVTVCLATSGKWKEWSDQKEEGAVFEFDADLPRSCGDKNVIHICNLIEEVDNVKTDLESKKGL